MNRTILSSRFEGVVRKMLCLQRSNVRKMMSTHTELTDEQVRIFIYLEHDDEDLFFFFIRVDPGSCGKGF